jgi:hypothetical protein
MLTKCANPKCNAQFRYLHEGKLFIVDNGPARRHCAERRATNNQTNDQLGYYWLCSTCSRSMVVVSGQSVQARLPAKHRGDRDREFI